MIVLKQLNYKINNLITWQKVNAMPNMTRRMFTILPSLWFGVSRAENGYLITGTKRINPDKQKTAR